MYIGVLPASMSVYHVIPGAHGGKKRALDSWNWSYRG